MLARLGGWWRLWVVVCVTYGVVVTVLGLGLLGLSLSEAFLAWVIPCLVILALGAAVHWVYQGFRQNRT